MMRPRKKVILDRSRAVYRGRFHAQGVKRDLMTQEQAEWEFLPSGKRRRRSEEQLEKLLLARYEEAAQLLVSELETRNTTKIRLSEGIQEWLDETGGLREEKTVRNYSIAASHFLEALGDFRLNSPPRGLSGRYVQFLGRRNNSDGTINSRCRVMQGFFNWAYREGLTPRPVRLQGVRGTRKPPGVLSSEQMGAVLERIEENLAAASTEVQRVSAMNQRRIWYMLRHTGMRGGEVRALPLAHISADAVAIRDVPDAGFRVKGRKEAMLPVAPALKEFLGEDISGRGPYERWYLDNGHGQVQWADTTAMARPFSRHFAALGFESVKPLHGFRASVATLLLNQGASPVLVQKLLRHSSITTTMGYHNSESLDVSRLLECL